MNKKIIVGTIIVFFILVCVIFTPIIGFQTAKSNSINASPLFNIRINRANKEESKDLTCDYIGKDETIHIPIPKRDIFKINIIKYLKYLMKMDKDKIKKSLTEFISNKEIWLNEIKKIDEGLFKKFSEFLNNDKTWIEALHNFNDIKTDVQSQLKNNPMIINYMNNNYSKGNNLETDLRTADTSCNDCGPTIIQFGELCLFVYFVAATFFIVAYSIIGFIIFVDLMVIITLVPLFLLMTIFTPDNCPYNPEI